MSINSFVEGMKTTRSEGQRTAKMVVRMLFQDRKIIGGNIECDLCWRRLWTSASDGPGLRRVEMGVERAADGMEHAAGRSFRPVNAHPLGNCRFVLAQPPG